MKSTHLRLGMKLPLNHTGHLKSEKSICFLLKLNQMGVDIAMGE